MTALARLCKNKIEKERKKGNLSADFIEEMQNKLDIYSGADRITIEEYTELSEMLQ